MRKVVVQLFISLDGVVEAPDKWQFEFDDQMAAAWTALLEQQDAILLGRVSYQDWAEYWPTVSDEDDAFANFINNTPKYVASSTLDTAEWAHSTIIKGSVADEIARLKREPGKNIAVHASASLAQSLLYDGLVDELALMIHPVIVNSGKRLYRDGGDLLRLDLIDAEKTSSGCVVAIYRPHNA
jgi:dihydrofolate reductase